MSFALQLCSFESLFNAFLIVEIACFVISFFIFILFFSFSSNLVIMLQPDKFPCLEYHQLFELLSQSFRVLQDNGVLIIETPNIDNLVSDSAIFDRAYSTCSATSSCIASIFNSDFPYNHGLRFVGDKFTPKFKSLFEILNEKYKTVGFSSVMNLNKYFGFNN